MRKIRRCLAHYVRFSTYRVLILGVFLIALAVGTRLPSSGDAADGSDEYSRYLPYVKRYTKPSGPLVARYVNNYVKATFYADMRYQPRQFIEGAHADPEIGDARIDDPAGYAGWDVFSTPNSSTNRTLALDKWLTVHLNRAATVAVVWRAGDPLPGWLGSWQRGDDVILDGQRYPTYVERFEKETVELGSVYDPQPGDGQGPEPRPTYLVLFGESDGTAPLPPPVPDGRSLPQTNETCPDWVHDQYQKVGPDGEPYRTWHPQIDPRYWCYFRHEHGSDPALFDADAPVYFDYAPQKAGMSEPHEGFKVYVFDDLGGHTWLVTQHMGTSGLGRVCTRFHSLSMASKDNQTGELLFSVHFLGDYGKSLANRTGEPLVPPSCPNQAEVVGDSTGERWIGVVTLDAISYEPWRVDGQDLIFGIQTGDFTINSVSSTATLCDSVACAEMIPTGRRGSFRLVKWSSKQLGFQVNQYASVFYTDPYGREMQEPDKSDAVEQFVRPDADILAPVLEFNCKPDTPWQVIYACDGRNENVNHGFDLEGALELPN